MLDVVLSRSKKRLNAGLINHVYRNITENDCNYGIVYLLHQIFAKILNQSDLDLVCGSKSREDLKAFLRVRICDVVFKMRCSNTENWHKNVA